MALAFNNQLERAGRDRLGIIVPWVYGEKQKRIMLEEFASDENKHPGEILLDKNLGNILGEIFYSGGEYEKTLKKWVDFFEETSASARHYLSGALNLETLSGKKISARGKDIAVELNRAPRVLYNVAPAYFTSFAYLSDILEHSLNELNLHFDRDLLKKGIAIADKIESAQKMKAIAYPATFSCYPSYRSRYEREILVPPIMSLPKVNRDKIDQGIFVTVSGILGMQEIYQVTTMEGLKIYTNDPEKISNGIKASPDLIGNPNIVFQFARSGWSSVWTSLIVGTPLVAPEFVENDDPEIYFNNRCLEEMKLAVIYRGQPLKEILSKLEEVKDAYRKITKYILDRWDTLDGNDCAAKIFAEDFLKTD